MDRTGASRLLAAAFVIVLAAAPRPVAAQATPATPAQPAPAAAAAPPSTIDCGASPGARDSCAADTSKGVVLLHQAGAGNCRLGTTWGFDQTGVWVADGCQATFVLTSRGALECGSDGTRQHCTGDTAAGVVLARVTSTTPTFRTRYDMPNMYAYAEARIFNDSVGPQGEDGFDVLAVGVHYGFSFKEFHRP